MSDITTRPTAAGHINLEVSDNQLLYHDDTKTRLDVNSTATYLYDEQTTGGGCLTLDSKKLIYNNGTTDLIESENTQTWLRNSSGAYFGINGNDLNYYDGNGQRFNLAFDSSILYDELNTIGGRLILENKTLRFYDGTNDRLKTDATNSLLISPDGTSSCNVTDEGTAIPVTKAFYIGVEDVDGSYRMRENGGSLVFERRVGGIWNQIGAFT